MRGNYRRTAWDPAAEAALDTQAAILDARGELDAAERVEASMDADQDRELALIRAAMTEPMPRRAAALLRDAIARHAKAEACEAAGEAHVHNASCAAARAEGHNRRVVAVTEAGRIAAAGAQQPERRAA